MTGPDDRLSNLYRQSSQETPSAQIDRAVLDRARKSVRRRVYSPYGGSWVVRGATVGVMVLGVLLFLTEPPVPQYKVSPRDEVQPSRTDSELMDERSEADESVDSRLLELKKKPAAPAGSEPGPDVNDTLRETQIVIPEKAERERLQQAPAMKADAPASKAVITPPDGPLASTYLQAGSFREKPRAIALHERLTALGFDVDIEEARLEDGVTVYRVRVGPFVDPVRLDRTRQRLQELNIETQAITVNNEGTAE